MGVLFLAGMFIQSAAHLFSLCFTKRPLRQAPAPSTAAAEEALSSWVASGAVAWELQEGAG